jgi:hypothetical protein
MTKSEKLFLFVGGAMVLGVGFVGPLLGGKWWQLPIALVVGSAGTWLSARD